MSDPIPTLEEMVAQQTAHLDTEGDRVGDPTGTAVEPS